MVYYEFKSSKNHGKKWLKIHEKMAWNLYQSGLYVEVNFYFIFDSLIIVSNSFQKL